MTPGKLYAAHRLSAAVLGPLVLIHLGLIVYAVQDGLSASEILARTRGSVFWGAFYSLFVIAAAGHAAIGLRNIAAETFGWRGWRLDVLAYGVGFGLIVLGSRAVVAVTL